MRLPNIKTLLSQLMAEVEALEIAPEAPKERGPAWTRYHAGAVWSPKSGIETENSGYLVVRDGPERNNSKDRRELIVRPLGKPVGVDVRELESKYDFSHMEGR